MVFAGPVDGALVQLQVAHRPSPDGDVFIGQVIVGRVVRLVIQYLVTATETNSPCGVLVLL